MRPKMRLQIIVIDFKKLDDDAILDMAEEFNNSFDKIADNFNPSTTKKYAGLFLNLHLWTVEVRKRFPEYLEEVEQEILLDKILNKLKIKTNE